QLLMTEQGEGLRKLWGSASNDVWAIGGPNVLHWDGVNWTLLPSIGVTGLWDISGNRPGNIWAAGYQSLAHFDGTNWKKMDLPAGVSEFRSILAIADNDVLAWAYNESYHWDGATWTPVATPRALRMQAVGGAAGRVWAVGESIAQKGAT